MTLYFDEDTTATPSTPISKRDDISPVTQKLGFTDVIGDAFVTNNYTVAGLKYLSEDRTKSPNGMSGKVLLDKLKADNINPDDYRRFLYVDNEAEYKKELFKVNLDYKAKDRLAQAGGAGIAANLTAGLLDVTSLVTGAGLIKTLKATNSIAKTAAITAGVTGATVYGGETLLRATQAGKSQEEVNTNAIVATLIGGALGAGGAAIGKAGMKAEVATTKAYVEDMSKIGQAPELVSDWAAFAPKVEAANGLVEGSPLNNLTKEQLGLAQADNAIARSVAKGMFALNKSFNPQVRYLSSASKTVRQWFLETSDTSLKPQAIKEGEAIPASIEIELRSSHADFTRDSVQFRSIYEDYRSKGGDKNFGEFRTAVTDHRLLNDSSDPHINQASDVVDRIYARVGKEAADVKLLGEEALNRTDERYLNRVFLTDHIKKNYNKFKEDVVKPDMRRIFQAKVSELNAIIKEVDAKGQLTEKALKAKEDLKYFSDPATLDSRLEQSSSDLIDNIIKQGHLAGFQPVRVGAKGPLKERVWDIPTRNIKDWIETDSLFLADRYSRQIMPEVAFKKRFGDQSLDDIFQKVKADYQEEIAKADPKDAAKLIKEREEIMSDMSTHYNLLKGTYRDLDPNGYIARGAEALKQVSYLRSLGRVVVSSLADVGTQVFRRGLVPVMKDTTKVFLNKLSKIDMSKVEARAYGRSFETANSMKTQSLFSVGDPMAFGTPFERGLGILANKMSNINLINPYNDFGQQIAVTGTEFRILENLEFVRKGKPLIKAEEEWMNLLGLGKGDRVAMLKQIDIHGTKDIENRVIPNFDKWDDRKLADKLKFAVNKEVDRTIIISGATDKPRYANTTLGKMLFQFQSYSLAFNNKVFLSSLQGGERHIAAGLLSYMALGTATYAIKQKLKGEDINTDVENLIGHAIDESGLLGVLSFGNSFAQVAGLDYRMLYDKDVKPRPNKDIWDALTGPAGGTLGLAINASKSGLQAAINPDKKFTQKDVDRLFSLLPMNNVFYLQPIFDELKDTAKQGLPKDNRS